MIALIFPVKCEFNGGLIVDVKCEFNGGLRVDSLAIQGGLQNLIESVKEKDPDKVSVGLSSSLDIVAELELLQVFCKLIRVIVKAL